MEILIMSCSTGGGHNAAAMAVREELEYRGHGVTFLDPFTLDRKETADLVANAYIRLVQTAPALFGAVYRIGDFADRLPVPSPVYAACVPTAKKLRRYLERHSFDAIVTTHLYPGLMLTWLKKQGVSLPQTLYISTDYTCIPFAGDIRVDHCIVPSEELVPEFAGKGIPENTLLPLGIPVRREFDLRMTKEEAKRRLGLDLDRKYYLVTGGSIGAGTIRDTIQNLQSAVRKKKENAKIIVLCGNNKKLYRELRQQNSKLLLVKKTTDKMALLMYACEVMFAKAGGLTVTEAHQTGIVSCFVDAIPGCETRNRDFVQKNPKIPYDARERICDLIEGNRGEE